MQNFSLTLQEAKEKIQTLLNEFQIQLGLYENNFSDLNSVGKYTLSLAMIIGRLEIFGVLILFIPSYWRS